MKMLIEIDLNSYFLVWGENEFFKFFPMLSNNSILKFLDILVTEIFVSEFLLGVCER